MATTNPLITQGVLNKVVASVNWVDFASLNVTAPYLGREGIRLALDGDSTLFIPTMTGAVTSPEPYMMITVSMHLLKTQSLAQQYKAQMELQALLGQGTIRPDVTTGLAPYDVYNCAIQSVRELNFSGEDAGFLVTCRGYYLTNNAMWQSF